MAPARLSDSQKQELVSQFKAGETAAALAQAFGCSPNTVSRTVKALLSPRSTTASSKSAVAAALPLRQPRKTSPGQHAAVKTEAAPEAPSCAVRLMSPWRYSSLVLDDDDFGADDSDEELDELSDDETFVAIAPLPGLGALIAAPLASAVVGGWQLALHGLSAGGS